MLLLLTLTLAPQLLCPSVWPLAMTAFAGHCRTWPPFVCSMTKRFAVQHRHNVALLHVDSWCAGAGCGCLQSMLQSCTLPASLQHPAVVNILAADSDMVACRLDPHHRYRGQQMLGGKHGHLRLWGQEGRHPQTRYNYAA